MIRLTFEPQFQCVVSGKQPLGERIHAKGQIDDAGGHNENRHPDDCFKAQTIKDRQQCKRIGADSRSTASTVASPQMLMSALRACASGDNMKLMATCAPSPPQFWGGS